MLGDTNAIATIGVKDLATARKFYEGKLGLKPTGPNEPGTLSYQSGSSRVLVYESQFAGTNKATAVTWALDDVPATVKELKSKGITFEHYDLPQMKLEGDVHVGGNIEASWFKDPDGNILAIVNSGPRTLEDADLLKAPAYAEA